jgi:hypothetical protein
MKSIVIADPAVRLHPASAIRPAVRAVDLFDNRPRVAVPPDRRLVLLVREKEEGDVLRPYWRSLS